MAESPMEAVPARALSPAGTYFDAERGVVALDRRRSGDRRGRLVYSLVYGGVRPRRLGGRRAGDHHRPVVDRHGPGLMLSSVLVLLLCVADALLTLTLISLGAREANPVMARFIYTDVERFAALKMALTGCGVLALVAVAHFRVFGLVRVASLLHAVLAGYAVLIAYELWMLTELT